MIGRLGAWVCPTWVAAFASGKPDQSLSSFSFLHRQSKCRCRLFGEPLLHAYHKKSYLEGLIEAEGWKIAS
jgi:hypothetical protein